MTHNAKALEAAAKDAYEEYTGEAWDDASAGIKRDWISHANRYVTAYHASLDAQGLRREAYAWEGSRGHWQAFQGHKEMMEEADFPVHITKDEP